MAKKICMEKDGKTLLVVESYTAEMLSIDCQWNILWCHCAPSAGSHDRYENITRSNCIALQILMLGICDESALRPSELVHDYIIDSQYRYAAVNELAVQELTPERPCPNRASISQSDVSDSSHGPATRIHVAEHIEEDGLSELIELGDRFATHGAYRVDLSQNRCDSSLVRQRR